MTIRLLLASALLLCAGGPAWAACGWYLMVPPQSAYDKKAQYLESFKILSETPLSKWNHAGSFDSPDACELVKASRVRAEHSVYDKAADGYRRLMGAKGVSEPERATARYLAEQDNANVNALMAARCIASDDPRLR